MLDCRKYEKLKARLPCYLMPKEYEKGIKNIVDKLEEEDESNKTGIPTLADQRDYNERASP